MTNITLKHRDSFN